MTGKPSDEPAIGIIGGSGVYEMDGLTDLNRLPISTPFGDPSDPLVCGRLHGRPVCFLPRHGTGHRLLPHEINHRANIWAMRSLNVRWLISVTAVGSLRRELAPRDIVIPHQLIDRTATGARHTFFGNGIAAHVSFADPYCNDLRKQLIHAATELAPRVHPQATYLCMNGPAFSTRAEANMHRHLGADIIGMTNAPEARLCREAEIAAAALALVTDYDCWSEDEAAVDGDAVIRNLQANSSLAKQIVARVIALIPQLPDSASHRALDAAVFTPRNQWPSSTKENLAPILNRLS